MVLSGIVPFNVLAKLATVFLATAASVHIRITIFRCAFWTLTLASQDLSVTLVCDEHSCFNRTTFDCLRVCLLPLYKQPAVQKSTVEFIYSLSWICARSGMRVFQEAVLTQT